MKKLQSTKQTAGSKIPVERIVSRTDGIYNLDITTATNDDCYFRLKNSEDVLRITNLEIEEKLARHRIKKLLYG